MLKRSYATIGMSWLRPLSSDLTNQIIWVWNTGEGLDEKSQKKGPTEEMRPRSLKMLSTLSPASAHAHSTHTHTHTHIHTHTHTHTHNDVWRQLFHSNPKSIIFVTDGDTRTQKGCRLLQMCVCVCVSRQVRLHERDAFKVTRFKFIHPEVLRKRSTSFGKPIVSFLKFVLMIRSMRRLIGLEYSWWRRSQETVSLA